MSNHTPGPWAVHPLEPMSVHQPEYQCWIPQNEADACLIAAAPDLLAALIKTAALLHPDLPEHKAAHAAIAKALGEKE